MLNKLVQIFFMLKVALNLETCTTDDIALSPSTCVNDQQECNTLPIIS